MQATMLQKNSVPNELTRLVPPDRTKTLLSLQEQTLKDLRAGRSVITILIDGLGYDSTLRSAEEGMPILRWAASRNKVNQNSAQWPSTTSVQITSLHAGVPVEEHGVVEWVMYEPKLGKLISPLPFSYAREKSSDTLYAAGLHPSDIFPKENYYRRLRAHGFESCVALPRQLTRSGFNQLFCQDTAVVGYQHFADGCRACTQRLASSSAPMYALLYIDDMDKISHDHTKDSPEFRSRLREILHAIEVAILAPLASSHNNVLVNITSDHGHHTIDPKAAVYLNQVIPAFDSYLQRNERGEVIPCSGGYRSLFIHALPERRAELSILLANKLTNVAEVLTIEQAMARGFFEAARCSEAFWRHVGNLIVLPYQGKSVGYYVPGVFEVKRRSLHGGASPEEMTTPLISFAIHDYRGSLP